MRLNLPRRTKQRVPGAPCPQGRAADDAVWALDFMGDALYNGKMFRILNVIGEANREALGIDVATGIPATRVVAFLGQRIDLHGRPKCHSVR